MPTLVIKTNASQATDVLIRDLGILIPNSGGSVTFTDLRNLQNCDGSANLRFYATDNAFGANNSTLILNNGTSDIPQSQVNDFISYVGGTQGFTGFVGVGATGVRGLTGLHLDGATGIAGVTGADNQGIQGITGLDSISGETGIRGVTGVIFSTGILGVTGSNLQGTTGLSGATGFDLNVGLVGASFGPTGIAGSTGITGATGIGRTSFIVGSTGTTSTSSTTYPTFASTGIGMATIPPAGSYFVIASTSVDQNSNTNQAFFMLFVAGDEVVGSERMFMQGTGTIRYGGIVTNGIVTVDGTQIVDMRFRVNTGTATIYEKNMILIAES